MQIAFNDVVPIYIQIADAIEDDILSGKLQPGEHCYSQLAIARELAINPATAGKSVVGNSGGELTIMQQSRSL